MLICDLWLPLPNCDSSGPVSCSEALEQLWQFSETFPGIHFSLLTFTPKTGMEGQSVLEDLVAVDCPLTGADS